MNQYATGDGESSAVIAQGSHETTAAEGTIHYIPKKSDFFPTQTFTGDPRTQQSRNHQPKLPSPSIRKAIEQALHHMRTACEAMIIAHEGDGVDMVELANAVEDYRSSVYVLWQYRDFGMESWKRVVAFAQQALLENKLDENMTLDQCAGLMRLAAEFLSNRYLASGDVRQAMSILSEAGFDTLAFFSPPPTE